MLICITNVGSIFEHQRRQTVDSYNSSFKEIHLIKNTSCYCHVISQIFIGQKEQPTENENRLKISCKSSQFTIIRTQLALSCCALSCFKLLSLKSRYRQVEYSALIHLFQTQMKDTAVTELPSNGSCASPRHFLGAIYPRQRDTI